jgi:hypothetical protein
MINTLYQREKRQIRDFTREGQKRPDLVANETLYQLSYTPTGGAKISRRSDLSATKRISSIGKFALYRLERAAAQSEKEEGQLTDASKAALAGTISINDH